MDLPPEKKKKRERALLRQSARLRSGLKRLQSLSERYTYLRLVSFLAGFILNGIVFFSLRPELLWLSVSASAIIFLAIVYYHNQNEETIARHEIWQEVTDRQLARMRLEWDNLPPGETYSDSPLGLDLDLVGPYSLHRLINTAVSPNGSRRLQDWLTTPSPNPSKTLLRQARVKELVNKPLFRKRLILNSLFASGETKLTTPESFLAWLQENAKSPSLSNWIKLLSLFAILNLILVLAAFLEMVPGIWPFSLGVYAVLLFYKITQIEDPFKGAAHLRDNLEQLSAVFHQLETSNFKKSPNLRRLCQPFNKNKQRPSRYLKRLNRIVVATGLRGNPVLAIALNLFLPYDLIFVKLLQDERLKLASLVPEWLEVWYELESLSSLANLAYLNPQYSFPILLPIDDEEKTKFRTRHLGHPLLPDETKICNDFRIDKPGSINIITGSNMSGKSTFLRTIGINLVLANSGGPVDANHLESSFFRLHTCIRITDSITTGISHFYAEVQCLKSLMDKLINESPLPLFFMIDEIFQGTNNRERLIGSRSYITEVAKKEVVGLISSHDLELADLAANNPAIRNFHFRDWVKDGRLHFDYTLHPGASPTTNALKIMEMEGLPISPHSHN